MRSQVINCFSTTSTILFKDWLWKWRSGQTVESWLIYHCSKPITRQYPWVKLSEGGIFNFCNCSCREWGFSIHFNGAYFKNQNTSTKSDFWHCCRFGICRKSLFVEIFWSLKYAPLKCIENKPLKAIFFSNLRSLILDRSDCKTWKCHHSHSRWKNRAKGQFPFKQITDCLLMLWYEMDK